MSLLEAIPAQKQPKVAAISADSKWKSPSNGMGISRPPRKRGSRYLSDFFKKSYIINELVDNKISDSFSTYLLRPIQPPQVPNR